MDHRVANHERQKCIIDLTVDRPQATSGIDRFPSDAVQHDRGSLRPADWPSRESDSNVHEESEQSVSGDSDISSRGGFGMVDA
jgi:hypothetical protein